MYRVRQKKLTECAIASLFSIAMYWQIPTSYNFIRKNTPVELLAGASIRDIITTSKLIGLSATGLSCNWDELHTLTTPFIVRIVYFIFFPHYVVIYGISNHSILVMNPDFGRLITYNKYYFQLLWSGHAIIFEKK